VTTDAADYCRQIEAYLCGKNDGHLIRVVGPAFEMVCGWAEQGVPLKIAFRGIDRYCERYYAKGGRRRPVRIEFCDADVLELFDDWRRAVGLTEGSLDAAPAPARKPGLASHIERVIARLSTLRAGPQRSAAFDEQVAAAVRSLDRLISEARHARGDVRAGIIERLAELDRTLIDAAIRNLDARTVGDLHREAEHELAAFGARLAPAARSHAVQAAFERLVRELLALPTIRHE
jgi:hypothetical protein